MPRNSKKIVFLTAECPFPPAASEHYRDAALIRMLSEHAEVDVLCFGSPVGCARELELPAGVRVTRIEAGSLSKWTVPFRRWRPQGLQGFSKTMAGELAARREDSTTVWVSGFRMVQYIRVARSLGYKVVLDQHGMDDFRLWNDRRTAFETFRARVLTAQAEWYGGRFCGFSHALVTSSDHGASRLAHFGSAPKVHVISHSVECAAYEPARSRAGSTLLFPGNLEVDHNREGMGWFIGKVLPRLRAALGSSLPRIVVASGATCPHEVRRELTVAGVQVFSEVPSLLPFFAEAAVVFAPIRSGQGIGPKVLGAMAAGRPVVSTPKGVDTLLLSPGYDCLIAERADTFTSAIVRLLERPALRQELGARAIETVIARYDSVHIRPLVEDLLRTLHEN